MAEKPTLGYWNIRARGDPIRNLLHHLGVEFEDKQYELTTKEDYMARANDWFANHKHNLGMHFPDLPYYIDGDVKHSQTVSILRSVASKYRPEYLGRTLKEQAEADAYSAAIYQLFCKWFGPYFFMPDYATKLEEGKAEAKKILDQIVACIGEKRFLAGNEPSYADFIVHFIVRVFRFYDEAMVNGDAKLVEYIAAVGGLEGVEASEKSQEGLLPFASFCAWQADHMPA